MPNAITISKQLKDILDQYGEEIREDLQSAVVDTVKATANELKRTSPKLTGSYRKGWRSDLIETRWGTVQGTVYNATDWQLTHLLNDGHGYVGRDGTRKDNVAKGDHHIDSASEFADTQLMVEVEKRLSND